MSPPSRNTVVGVILPICVIALIAYSWYIYTFRICVARTLQQNTPEAVIFIVLASLSAILAIVSYVRVLFSPPGKAVHVTPLKPHGMPRFWYAPGMLDPKTLKPSVEVTEATALLPAVSISRMDGMPRYCETCQCYKPDRTHHCKECDTCILRMDHHCPWISGCVGHRNYKFFFLFVLYTDIYALWVLISAIPQIVIALNRKDEDVVFDPQWIVLLVLGFLFGMTLLGFVAVHGYYIIKNQTTIEHISRRPYEVRIDFDATGHNYEIVTTHYTERLWDMGRAQNWRFIMGNNPWGWFVPISGGLGDGCVFQYSDTVYNHVVERAQRQRQLLNPSTPPRRQ